MSINRDRLARLGAALALLAVVLPGPVATASQAIGGQRAIGSSPAAVARAMGSGSRTAAQPGILVSRSAAAPGVLTSGGIAAAGALASWTAAPLSLGTRPVAVPGALGASTTGNGANETGSTGTAGPATGNGDAGLEGTWTGAIGLAPPRVKAHSVLLADEETGEVLFQRAERQPRAMASTTKVMTALLALERLDQRRTVVIGTEPTMVGEESLELRKGERLTVHQLLLGLLVKSANDAAVALADAVDGSAAVFVQRMNGRAAALGLDDTHYVTPYGLDRPGHRTSARDLARLWEVAMRRADFRALVSTRVAQLPGPPRLRKFTNTNQLLGSYAWAVGGKTGFTSEAGRCLVASASRGGRRLVAVALGSPDAFADVRALFEYGFTAFDWVRLAQRGQEVTLAGVDGQTASAAYEVTADVDALVRRDLLDELTLAPPARLVAGPSSPPTTARGSGGGPLTVWIQARGQRLAPLRLGPVGAGAAGGLGVPGATSATGPEQAIPPMSSVAAGLVPPDSVPAAIDPFLRRASS